ncbi:MAG: galactokinase [Deltaproteobacteria bacterium]|nr:galactokinase [Deltaproteobacteria bacterium]MBW1929200.1 galactokinase [Deltaproteobacteria bacterium]MBW2026700.1 galactokinase [Deltaproteobacteria bacterium]MBW2126043.1 galactokinase [Deltaproteobacteria bacterium]
MPKRLKKFPCNKRFSASAPCRIDAGGTWDIKAMALPFEVIKPTTVNIALNLRTTVTLGPYKKDRIKIASEGFPRGEEADPWDVPLTGPFALIFAAIRYVGLHGVEVNIHSEAPVKSAMGGSSTALVATLKALSKVMLHLGQKPLVKGQILHLAYHLEDAISGGGCGMQDQAAAAYGGINQWVWQYSHRTMPFQRVKIGKREHMKALSSRLLVAYSGKTHASLRINHKWLKDFLSGKTTEGWIKANEVVHRFARSLQDSDWAGCAKWLRQEMAIRRQITPEALIPETSLLIDQAEQVGCGARFAGAGAGGVVWAIGPKERINKLRKVWTQTLAGIKSAKLLECRVDGRGVS